MTILNDIRKATEKNTANGSNPSINQNTNALNNLNPQNKLNLLQLSNKNQLADFESKINSNIYSLAYMNNLQNLNGNGINLNNDANAFQPLDISEYRLKELNSKINFPNNKQLITQLTNKNNNNFRNQESTNLKFKQNNDIYALQRQQQNSIPISNSSINDPILNSRMNLNAEIPGNLNTNFNKINNNNNNNATNNQEVYKNILDYLAYNNQMMLNIQKLLLQNSANSPNIYSQRVPENNNINSKSQYFLSKENISNNQTEDLEDFNLLNNILENNNKKNINFQIPPLSKQVFSKNQIKINRNNNKLNTNIINSKGQLDFSKLLFSASNNPQLKINKPGLELLQGISNENQNPINVYQNNEMNAEENSYNNNNGNSGFYDYDNNSVMSSVDFSNRNLKGSANTDNFNLEFLKKRMIGN